MTERDRRPIEAGVEACQNLSKRAIRRERDLDLHREAVSLGTTQGLVICFGNARQALGLDAACATGSAPPLEPGRTRRS
jgi:hypothetical protein